MGLAMFFFAIFAILGVSLWHGRVHYRCYRTEYPDENGIWEASPDNLRLCEHHESCEDFGDGYNFCGSRYELFYVENRGNLSPEELDVDMDIYELNYGITNFDDVASAFLTIFQCITMEGWTKIMNIYEDAGDLGIVIMYFVTCVIVCSFFLLNLTIAVMLMKYEELDKTQDNNKHSEELRQLGRAIRLPAPLIDFLIKQNGLQIASGASKILKQEDSFFKQLFAKKEAQVDTREPYYSGFVVSHCYSVIMHPYFDASIIFIIILNTLTLSLDVYPRADDWVMAMLTVLNYIFTIIFTIEATLKIVGLGPRAFVRENLNKFDLAIVIVSLIELVRGGGGDSNFLSGFRALRLGKIFRLFKSGDLRILLDSIQFTLTTI